MTLWNPPLWTRHVAGLLTVPAFVLIAAAGLGLMAWFAFVHTLHVRLIGVRPFA